MLGLLDEAQGAYRSYGYDVNNSYSVVAIGRFCCLYL